VTFNIFDRKFCVDFLLTRENWSRECVDLVAPDGLVFLLMNLFAEAELVPAYSLGSHAKVFQSKVYMGRSATLSTWHLKMSFDF
jgi:hypothetical protein